MLITLRNSGALGIQYHKIINPSLLKDILEKPDDNIGLHDAFLSSTQLDSFVVMKDDITLLHLNVSENGYGDSAKNMYEIIIEADKKHYRLYYGTKGKPDFFKILFKYFYPEQAEIQVEELV